MNVWKLTALWCTIVFTLSLKAQTKDVQYEEWTRGLRVGFDISRLGLYQFQPERKALEMSFDCEWKPQYFATLEIGKEDASKSVTEEIENFSYTSTGWYSRIGFDHNILRRDEASKNDMVFTGLRYGFCSVTQRTDHYLITEKYWGSVNGTIPTQIITGHWLELVLGARVEMLKNVYVGGGARVRFKLYAEDALNYPLALPGFGNGSKKVTMGLNYYVSYQIPFMKMRRPIPLKVDPRKAKLAGKK